MARLYSTAALAALLNSFFVRADRSDALSNSPDPSIIASYTKALNSSLPTAGSGLQYALACNNIKNLWMEDGGPEAEITSSPNFTQVVTAVETSVTYSVVSLASTHTYFSNSTPYTLCDGYPRYDGYINTTHSATKAYSTSIYTTLNSSTIYNPATTPIPAPVCTINPSDCSVLNSMYNATASAYSSSSSAWSSQYFSQWITQGLTTGKSTGPITTVPGPPSYTNIPSPVCGPATYRTYYEVVGDPVCAIGQASVQLLYWPVETSSGNFCNGSKTTIPATETITGKPNTAVYNDVTLTSPTVYLSVQGVWDFTSNGVTYTNQTGILLPQSSTAVSSFCGVVSDAFDDSGKPQPVDYANFNYPVPASAYRCQPKCWSQPKSTSSSVYTNIYSGSTETYTSNTVFTSPAINVCSTIWNDYAPALSVPTDIFAMNAATNLGGSFSCGFILDKANVLWDPPIALSAQATLDGPSTPHAQSATSTTSTVSVTAEPANSPGKTTATSTPPSAVVPTSTASPPPAPPPASSQTSLPPSATSVADPAQGSSAPSQANKPSSSTYIADPAQGSLTKTSTSTVTAAVGGIIASIIGLSSQGSPASNNGQQANPSAQGTPVQSSNGNINPAGVVASVLAHSSAVLQQSSNLVDPVSAAVTGIIVTDGSGGHHTAIAGSSGLVIGATTVEYGQSTSLAGIGNVIAASTGIVVQGTTEAYQPLPASQGVADPSLRYTAAGVTVPAGETGPVAIASGLTLTPGGAPITVSGHALSLAPSGSYLVVDGSTQRPAAVSSASAAALISAFVVGSATILAGATTPVSFPLVSTSDAVLIPGGPAVTISGEVLSLGPSGSYLVVNGSTIMPTSLAASASAPRSSTIHSTSGVASAQSSGTAASTSPGSAPAQSSTSTSDAGQHVYSAIPYMSIVLVLGILYA
ncbi:hypothetical protein LTR78_007230 [Recurvomyces mirabilis]|uniref:Uncharacterized protein n=1 Tax=Recurvomyces mirabilis TaxID=574656 RepID=A0AAE0WJI8_9PEZI|nr:hypothetical protein LTR78_007230 [Recurvomyces mirabilis]KAK5155527.1 hypothetical protein LTS14_005788 [Recurvomyces mirabilis]